MAQAQVQAQPQNAMSGPNGGAAAA
ncbi:hypothetical protein A2U01_0080507, partial [Trifolium medium]|nr:hypothetical protein [Trifolium medium]